MKIKRRKICFEKQTYQFVHDDARALGVDALLIEEEWLSSALTTNFRCAPE